MKKELIKKLISLMIAVLILVAIPVMAFAEESKDIVLETAGAKDTETVSVDENQTVVPDSTQIPGGGISETDEISDLYISEPNDSAYDTETLTMSPDSKNDANTDDDTLKEEKEPDKLKHSMTLYAAPSDAVMSCPKCGSTNCQEIKTPAKAPTLTEDGLTEGTKCSVCGQYIVEPTKLIRKGYLDLVSIGANKEVYVDGKRYDTDAEGHLTLDKDSYSSLIVYKYNNENATDKHTQYPTGMSVWFLNYTANGYTVTRKSEFDDIMQYCGTSIRVTGKKGVRIVTGIPVDKKKALASSAGYAGYTLEEDGTLLSKADRVTQANPLVLGGSGIVSNYAYKRGVADPIFKTEKGLSKYTNAMTGFTLQQCVPDFAMRPYMKIKEKSTGKVITLYGGIINRSIQYVANQNKNAFKKGSSAYEYIWSIINANAPETQTATKKLIAHKGYSDAAPENTVAAFDLAGKQSAFWGIETDVRETKDGVLICSHDDTADRMTNGTGEYEKLDYSYVKTLIVDAGNGLSKYSGQRVCTFSEYLDICKKYNKIAVVHLKQSSIRAVDNIVKMVKDKGMLSRTIFQCSVVEYLKEIKSKAPDATLWYLVYNIDDAAIKGARDIGCKGVNSDSISKSSVALGNSAGLKTACWIATTTSQKDTYFGYGLDFVCCNKPL